jgi:hypothetical protein
VENNLKDERFILAHSFRGFSPLPADCVVSGPGEVEHHESEHVVEQSSSPYGSQETEKERDQE